MGKEKKSTPNTSGVVKKDSVKTKLISFMLLVAAVPLIIAVIISLSLMK